MFFSTLDGRLLKFVENCLSMQIQQTCRDLLTSTTNTLQGQNLQLPEHQNEFLSNKIATSIASNQSIDITKPRKLTAGQRKRRRKLLQACATKPLMNPLCNKPPEIIIIPDDDDDALLQVSIITKDYPETIITHSQYLRLKAELQNSIRGVRLGTTAPVFKSVTFDPTSAMVLITSGNIATRNWLLDFIPTFKPWDGAELEIENYKMVFTLTEGPMKYSDNDEILAYLKEQNEGLHTERWVVELRFQSKKKLKRLNMFCKIDRESMKTLVAKKHVAFLGLEEVKFQPYNKLPRFPRNDPVFTIDQEESNDVVEVKPNLKTEASDTYENTLINYDGEVIEVIDIIPKSEVVETEIEGVATPCNGEVIDLDSDEEM